MRTVANNSFCLTASLLIDGVGGGALQKEAGQCKLYQWLGSRLSRHGGARQRAGQAGGARIQAGAAQEIQYVHKFCLQPGSHGKYLRHHRCGPERLSFVLCVPNRSRSWVLHINKLIQAIEFGKANAVHPRLCQSWPFDRK